jgi:hypothetical protein
MVDSLNVLDPKPPIREADIRIGVVFSIMTKVSISAQNLQGASDIISCADR